MYVYLRLALSCMNGKNILVCLFVNFLLIFSYTYLNDQVASIAEGSTNTLIIDLALLFPILWIGLIIINLVLVMYGSMK